MTVYCEVCYSNIHPLNGPLSGTTQVSRYQKGKTDLDFTEARESEWQWHQLGHMQVCTSLQTDNHASTPPLSFLQAGCPSCRPTNSVKALAAIRTIFTFSWKHFYKWMKRLLSTENSIDFWRRKFFNFCVWAVARAKIVSTVCQVFLWSVPGQDAVCTDNITIECRHVVLGRTLWSLVSHQQFPPWANSSFCKEFCFYLFLSAF